MFYSIVDRNASSAGYLFLATFPDPVTADRIFRLARVLRRAHGFSGKLIARERLHVSLFFLGDLPACTTSDVCHALDRMQMSAFDVTFDRSVSFRGGTRGRPFVLIGDDGPTPLKALRDMLGMAVAPIGFRRHANRAFTPHVTLLYDTRSADEHPVFEPIRWAINEVVLIHSRNGHAHLRRWPLGAH